MTDYTIKPAQSEGDYVLNATSGSDDIAIQTNAQNDSITVNAGDGSDAVDVNGGSKTQTIVINGGGGDDDIDVNGAAGTSVTVNGDGGDDTIVINGAQTSAANAVVVNGGEGDDNITLNGNAVSVVTGGAGNDVMKGSAGADKFVFSFSGFEHFFEEKIAYETHTETFVFNSDPSKNADWRAWENYEGRLDAFLANKDAMAADGWSFTLDGSGAVSLTGKQISNLSGASVGDDGKFVYADNAAYDAKGKMTAMNYEWQDWTGTKTVTTEFKTTVEVNKLGGLDGHDQITNFDSTDSFQFKVGSDAGVSFLKGGIDNFDKFFDVSYSDDGLSTILSTADNSWSVTLDDQHLTMADIYAKVDFIV
jgi:aspartate 1-decarboxylase